MGDNAMTTLCLLYISQISIWAFFFFFLLSWDEVLLGIVKWTSLVGSKDFPLKADMSFCQNRQIAIELDRVNHIKQIMANDTWKTKTRSSENAETKYLFLKISTEPVLYTKLNLTSRVSFYNRWWNGKWYHSQFSMETVLHMCIITHSYGTLLFDALY